MIKWIKKLLRVNKPLIDEPESRWVQESLAHYRARSEQTNRRAGKNPNA